MNARARRVNIIKFNQICGRSLEGCLLSLLSPSSRELLRWRGAEVEAKVEEEIEVEAEVEAKVEAKGEEEII